MEVIYYSVWHDDRPVTVRPRASLAEAPDTAVVLGEAPDGLPLILRVERRSSIEGAVLSALGTDGPSLAPAVAAALERLETSVRQQARQAGLEQLGEREVYRCSAHVGALMGQTLLGRILGPQSPLILTEDRHSPSTQADRVAITSAVAMAAEPLTIINELAGNSCLAVPLRDGAAYVVKAADGETLRTDAARPLVLEELRALPSLRYHYCQDGEERFEPLALAEDYARATEQGESLGWSVARIDVAEVIVGLARAIQTLHDCGHVHGDVKPGNALLTCAGPQPIDALEVPLGALSPAATPGWAAPEQVLARAVTAATDVYALGLMAMRVVSGAIYGEERSFVVPTGGGERRRLRLFSAPDVFIDPSTVALTHQGQRAWQRFLASCAAFEPEQRLQSAGAFADELAGLLADHPPPGRLGLRGGPGQLTRNVVVLGRVQPAWVITDRR